MLGLDIYRQPFRLLLPDGNGMYRSLMGSIMSVITLALIITYGCFEASEVFGDRNYRVQTYDVTRFYSLDQGFGASDGFIIAVLRLAY